MAARALIMTSGENLIKLNSNQGLILQNAQHIRLLISYHFFNTFFLNNER